MWTSLTSVWENAGTHRQVSTARTSILRNGFICEKTGAKWIFRRKAVNGPEGRTAQPRRTRALGRNDRRPFSRRAIITSLLADVSTAFDGQPTLFVKKRRQAPKTATGQGI